MKRLFYSAAVAILLLVVSGCNASSSDSKSLEWEEIGSVIVSNEYGCNSADDVDRIADRYYHYDPDVRDLDGFLEKQKRKEKINAKIRIAYYAAKYINEKGKLYVKDVHGHKAYEVRTDKKTFPVQTGDFLTVILNILMPE